MAHVARAKDPRGTVRRLLGFFRERRAMLVVVLACVIAYSLLGLVGPYLMGRALDRYIARRDASGLQVTALLMLGSYLAANVFQLLASWLMADVSQRALSRLRRELFTHVQTLPMAFFERRASGDVMSRLTNDVEAINQATSQNVTALFGSVLSMLGILVAMFVLDVRLALASALVVPLMFWFTGFVAKYTRRGFTDLQRALGKLNAVMEEAIAGQKVVTAFRRNASVIAAFRAENEAAYRAGVTANTYALLLMPLTTVLGNLFTIVLVALGAALALAGLVSVGIIATFVSYGQNFVQPLRQLSNLYNTLQAALAGAERVFEILDEPGETDEGRARLPSGRARGDVRFENVGFAYVRGRPVLDDVSLTTRPGETVALVGPTGAGKTTVINLLTRFYDVDVGRITIDGVDIRDLPKADLRRQLGLVLQDTHLFGMTVRENIRYGRLDASDEEVVRAAELAEADHFIRQLPAGYDTPLTERGANLSQGQRQLLAIARMLLADPAVLVLDEATSSVDTRTEARIQRALLRLMRGRTTFVIAHRLSTIVDSDQVLVVDGGRIVERGTHVELLARGGAYHQLYMSQFKGRHA